VTDFDDRDQLLEELGKALAHGLELAGKLEAAEAEVERLQGDLAAVKAQLIRVDDALADSEAEIERLRDENTELRQTLEMQSELRDEVERLRAELAYVRKRHLCDEHQDIHDAARALAEEVTPIHTDP
jgi:chromosome segregation ATPase